MIRITKLFGIRIRNPFSNGDKAYVCCELVAEALKQLGFPGPKDLDQVDLVQAREMVRAAADEKGKT